jgi:hypothetical protein
VTEPNPTDTRLDLLDPAEEALYRDLDCHALGQSVRLEQERARFTAIEGAPHSQVALFRPGDEIASMLTSLRPIFCWRSRHGTVIKHDVLAVTRHQRTAKSIKMEIAGAPESVTSASDR